MKISENRVVKEKVQNYLGLKSINTITDDNFDLNESIYFEPLGRGKIVHIDRQNTLTKGKYNLLIDVEFDLGQSCRFAKLMNKERKNSPKLYIF